MVAALPKTDLTRVSRVAVFSGVAEAAADWSELEAVAPASAYQTLGFLGPWYDAFRAGEAASPMIVAAYDAADRPLLLAPLVVRRRGPLRVAFYAGGRHSNLNMPLARPGFAPDAASARALLSAAAARASARPNLFVLLNQPRAYAGAPNPFAFAGRPSPSHAYGATIGADAEAFFKRVDSKSTRAKMKSKAAKLSAELGALRCERATTPARAKEILSAFVDQKTVRFTAKNIDAGFADPATRAFLDALATADPPALHLHALLAGERIVATYGGLARDGRWHVLFNSFDTAPEVARSSPANLLLRDLVRDLGAHGFTSFDLGIGEAEYKSALCDERIELVDTVAPVDPLGAAWAGVERARLDLKRRIKQTPWALALVERMRAIRA